MSPVDPMNASVRRGVMCAALLSLAAGCGERDPARPEAGAAEAPNAPEAGSGRGARSTLGTLTTRVDGRTVVWETLAGVPGDPDRRPSAAVAHQGPMALLNLQAHMPGAPMQQAVLSTALMEQGGAFQPMEDMGDFFMSPEGADGPQLMSTQLHVQWDRLELGADGGHVQGRFTGELCPLDSAPGAGVGCVPVEGEFDTAVRVDEALQGVLGR